MTTLEHKFVDYIPADLEPGFLYIALEFGAVMHLCPDGCGERISTPLHPAQWSLTYDGRSVSLSPSVGSGSLCGSHYWIRNDTVSWSYRMTQSQFKRGREHDQAAARHYYEPDTASAPQFVAEPSGLLVRIIQRLRQLTR